MLTWPMVALVLGLYALSLFGVLYVRKLNRVERALVAQHTSFEGQLRGEREARDAEDQTTREQLKALLGTVNQNTTEVLGTCAALESRIRDLELA